MQEVKVIGFGDGLYIEVEGEGFLRMYLIFSLNSWVDDRCIYCFQEY